MKNILGKTLVLLLNTVAIFFLAPTGLMADKPNVEVSAKPPRNITPVADAGADQTVTLGSQVDLDGSGSYDPDDSPEVLTYLWQIKKAPRGSTAILSGATDVDPTFTPDLVGKYTVTLIVNDGIKNSRADTMYVTVTEAPPNTPPVANAGPHQNVETLSLVTLDGSGSSDVDAGDTLSYSWTIQSVPVGSTVTALTNPTTVVPTFTPDVDGAYVIDLVVNDGEVDSAVDYVIITAATANSASTLKKTGQTNVYTLFDDGYYQIGVTPSYTRYNDVVTDHITGLMWQDDGAVNTVVKTWAEVEAYCRDDVNTGEYTDWRWPTIAELQTIVVNAAYDPSIDTIVFVNYTTSSDYWSSTTHAANTSDAWIVNFYNGRTYYYSKTANDYVRCVRAGQ